MKGQSKVVVSENLKTKQSHSYISGRDQQNSGCKISTYFCGTLQSSVKSLILGKYLPKGGYFIKNVQTNVYKQIRECFISKAIIIIKMKSRILR